MEIVQTNELAQDLLTRATESAAGRAAQSLRGGRENQMRHTMIALANGASLAEHDNPGEATLFVWSGSVQLTAGDEGWVLQPGEYCEIPPVKHGLIALADSVVLLSTVNL